nr:unnamed protein product [Callosobruchus chinensis]
MKEEDLEFAEEEEEGNWKLRKVQMLEQITTVADVHQDDESHDIVADETDNSPNNTFALLGIKPDKSVHETKPLHEELVDGISKEQKQSIFDKYPLYKNCPILQAPALGPELTACLDTKTLRQDKFLTNLHVEAGHTVAALGSKITTLLNDSEKINRY